MGWTFLNNLIDVTGYITADSTWRVTAAITELPADTTTIWLRVRQTDATARGVGATHPAITSTMTGLTHVNKPQYFMVGGSSQAFRYYCTNKTNMFWEILAYSNNANEAYTTAGAYPTKTPAGVADYEDKSFSELAAGSAFAAILIDQSTAYQSGFRHDGAAYNEYYYKHNDSITTVFCPLANNVGEIHVGSVGFTPCYLTAGLVNGANRLDAPQAITIPGTGWRTIDASGVFPAGAAIAILECRNISIASARSCALRNTGSSENIVSGVNIQTINPGPCSQFRLVGLNANRQFDINVSNTADVLVKAYGYITNGVELTLADHWTINIGMLEFGKEGSASARKSMYIEIEMK